MLKKIYPGNVIMLILACFIYYYLFTFINLSLNYAEFSFYYKITLIKLIISIILEISLYCLKHSKKDLERRWKK